VLLSVHVSFGPHKTCEAKKKKMRNKRGSEVMMHFAMC
jgi:hypothetical protein